MRDMSSTACTMLMAMAWLIGGCTVFEPDSKDGGRLTVAGPDSVLLRDLEQIDLFAVIARGDSCEQYEIVTGDRAPGERMGCRAAIDKALKEQGSSGHQEAIAPWHSAALARAYARFDETNKDSKPRIAARNQIQDEIFRASEQRCNAFKKYLQRIQSASNFGTGSLATLLGGLGAIFTNPGVARALSGSAGITTGIGAQFSENYFFNMTVPLIVDAIDNERAAIHAQAIQQRAGSVPYGSYTLQHALLDAVRYDGACSIPSGLKAAGEAVKAVRNPGLDMIEKAQQRQLQLTIDRLEKEKTIQGLQRDLATQAQDSERR